MEGDEYVIRLKKREGEIYAGGIYLEVDGEEQAFIQSILLIANVGQPVKFEITYVKIDDNGKMIRTEDGEAFEVFTWTANK